MKSRIALKLTLYFSATLVLFSIIIGSVFLALFRNHTLKVFRDELEKRAVTISSTLSGYMSSGASLPGPGMGMSGKPGFGAYLRFIDDIAMTNVWIIDRNLELMTGGQMHGTQYHYADLPQDAEAVVNEALKGNTSFSEGFSSLLNANTLTIATPIESNGEIMGALLLHSPVTGMHQAVAQGVRILVISIAAALLLSAVLSVLLVISFTRPLTKMKMSTVKLANGDYSAKTGVRQTDEIGELANAIDVLSERLELSRRESEKLDQLRRDFVANISHELRTPVTVLRGSLEALCDEVVTDPVQVYNYHRQMLNESMHLQRLVNDLLDLSRLQNTDFKMEIQEFNLGDVIGDAVRSATQIASEKNIEIMLSRKVHPPQLFGDYGRLRQMFLIVLDNAVKFSYANSKILVCINDKTVSVTDKGTGIAQEDLPYIFDRFYKVKSSENSNGSGLGLAIAKQIADRHGITISVSSIKNESTEFRFDFSKAYLNRPPTNSSL